MPGPSGVARQSRPRKRAEKPEAKVRERRGNSKVPSYKDLYSSSSSEDEHPKVAKSLPKKPKIEGKKGKLACDQCNYTNDYPSKLKQHIDTVHLGLRPHKCTQCDMAFGLKGDLNKHIKSAHENAFVCPTCNKSCGNSTDLKIHIDAIHEGIKHKCDFCEFTSSWKKVVVAHIKKKHQN